MTVPAALALMGASAPANDLSIDLAVVALGTFTVPVVDGGRVGGMLEARIAVRTSDAGAVSDRLPVFRSTLRTALAEEARLRVSPWQAVDTAELTAALDKAARHSSPAIAGILLLEVRARPA